ncbi:FRG domain-containing protein [Burkholderia vietnamiensis]|uniref:FRG domain-containing protein n=1 Tax=Burkholderia vietnamiensis TaxID=60552 RepID=UPI00158D7FCE|nr:FRG domain-containing protein [Burkholderia vietnamiensis]
MKLTAETLKQAQNVIEVATQSWQEFEEQLSVLEQSYSELERQRRGLYVPHLLFRGQTNATFGLQTTLERYPVQIASFGDYYQAAYGARHEIEAASGNRWEMPYPHIAKEAAATSGSSGFFVPPAYDYLVYLRHHGFPSPFLDWSRSAYVAAFFAFSGCKSGQPEDVAVYVYLESTGKGKIGSVGSPAISALGPIVRTHRRHFIQQAEYTICAAFLGNDWMFTPHESAIGREAGQDVLLKFIVPARERVTALRKLDQFNLNAWSIYGSEEGLMQTMAMREFEFSDWLRRREIDPEYQYRMALAEALSGKPKESKGTIGG